MKDLDTEIENEGTPTEPTSNQRDWETEAKAMGWNPNFEGPDKIDAKEFVQRKPLFDDLKKTRRKVRELETAVMAQQKFHRDQLEHERTQILNQLKQEKKTALEAGDVAKVFEIDEHIQEAQKPIHAPTIGIPPEYSDFLDSNDWYEKDPHMKRWADSYGIDYHKENPKISVKDVFTKIAAEAREVFPHKFKNEARSKNPSVESTTNRGIQSHSDSVKIPREHRTIVEAMWKQGAWGNVSFKQAMDKYIKDYTDRFGAFD